ncbi:carboxypeptidase-like regulatory domain-containing protein [Chryseobacterium gleum]|uniref:carboxypeptidase-like regulatory domain-containing protein n=1 Tax=Chryseobacterium gleum TaxID=250 RepID=UPI001E3AF48E|nr:carboxypeptidase-like regulatory domain-containing protein [Chryseobacterium gleum]MCD9618760.1 carboxypeptidase-like regulatory domain-containing protein [Chryseobacterium gleum]
MIKKLSLISLFTLLPASYYYAQTTVFAYLKDADGKPVEQANVDLKGAGNDAKADKIGYFQFTDLMPGHYQIMVTKPNFETKMFEFDVTSDEKRKDLGVITLYSALNGADQGLAIVEDSGESDSGGAQQTATVGLLQSSQDVFNRIASFDLGPYWFRPRGIDSRTGENMINGVSMAAADNGDVDFSTWGGLNEITRYPEISANHAPSEYAFGGTTGVFYKNTKASEYRKGSQLTYSLTNRNYRNRLSYRFSSGMNKNGWAFTGMIARRWAQEGIQDGTAYDAYSGYIGIEKKFSDSHTMTLNAIGSKYARSSSSPSTQEVYDFRGVHYNSYWGWQNGDKRNERVKRGFQPMIQLQDFWKINKNSQLWTSVSYQFGKEYSSRLDWYRANNPSPTYYRNLPSYWLNYKDPSPEQAANIGITRDWWTNDDQSHTQINWDNLYNANRNVEYNALLGGRRAAYYLVDDVKDDKVWNVSTHYTYNFTDTSRFILNLSYQNYRSEQYREVNDLLGADFALNMDPFASNTNAGSVWGKFNTRESDTDVAKREGDRIGYSYIFRRQEFKINPAFKFSTGKFDVFVSGLFGYTTNSREGLFQHYLYESSYGKGADQNFWNAGIKGQVTYKINGRNFLVYNGAYFSQSPFLNDIYFNTRVSGVTTPGIKNVVVDANDLSYVISTPIIKLRLTGYLVNTQNETSVQRYFAQGVKLTNLTESGDQAPIQDGAFITQVLAGANKRNMGIELGAQVKLTPTLTASGLLSLGQYTYTNNPTVYFASDAVGTFRELDGNGNIVSRSYTNMGEATLKNYRQGGTPQEAYTLGLRYSSPKYWWLGATWNYFGHSFLDPSPVTRTERFYTNPNTPGVPYDQVNDEELARVLTPTKLPSAFFFNVNAGKSWMIGKYYVLVSASVNNILNNRNYITGGFEQTRNVNYIDYANDYDSGNMVFAPKYWYNQGRSYFVNLQFRF